MRCMEEEDDSWYVYVHLHMHLEHEVCEVKSPLVFHAT